MRYFIIFYNWTAFSKWGNGNMTISMSGFPSRKELLRILNERNQDVQSEQIVITNIIKLSKKDYESWNE